MSYLLKTGGQRVLQKNDRRRFQNPQEEASAIHTVRMQIYHTGTERYHCNVPVEYTDKTCDFASTFILNQVDVPGGYRMALIARVMNGAFPDGYFVLILGNSIRHMIGAMRTDMGATPDADSEFANVKVIHGSRAHGLSDEVEALHTIARGLSYRRIAKPLDESIEKTRAHASAVADDDSFYDNWPSQRY